MGALLRGIDDQLAMWARGIVGRAAMHDRHRLGKLVAFVDHHSDIDREVVLKPAGERSQRFCDWIAQYGVTTGMHWKAEIGLPVRYGFQSGGRHDAGRSIWLERVDTLAQSETVAVLQE